MSNSPWEIQEREPRTYFGLVSTDTEERTSSRGNTYWQIKFNILPLAGGEAVERSYFSFGRDWNDITLKSLHALANAGKVDNPAAVDEQWVQYRWEQWQDYSNNTVQYYQNNNPDKLEADGSGKQYVTKSALFFEDVFSDESAAIAAHDERYGVEVKEDNVDDIPGFGPAKNGSNGNGAAPQVDKDTAAAFLAPIVKNAMHGNAVNRDELAQEIAGIPMLAAHFTVDSPEVQAEIKQVEAALPL